MAIPKKLSLRSTCSISRSGRTSVYMLKEPTLKGINLTFLTVQYLGFHGFFSSDLVYFFVCFLFLGMAHKFVHLYL
jgi:hypothetical protein